MDHFEALEGLFNEVRLGMHRLVQISEALHRDEPVSLGMRAVLEYLQRNGDAAVPQIARDRAVTRQHIQILANELLDQRLVASRDNPAHRRSPLLCLTTSGEKLIRNLRAKERRALNGMEIETSRRQLEAATRTLRQVRLSLKDPG